MIKTIMMNLINTTTTTTKANSKKTITNACFNNDDNNLNYDELNDEFTKEIVFYHVCLNDCFFNQSQNHDESIKFELENIYNQIFTL